MRIIAPEGSFDDVLPTGEIGEICLSGASLAAGYLGDPERTKSRFVDGWWRSGDLGRLDEDGFLFFEGRADNMINTGGIKVYGEEIEAILLAHPGIQMVAVVGRPDEKWGNRVVAHIVASGDLTEEDVLAFCDARGMAGFKKPRELHFHDALPLGPTGKLDRGALKS